MKKEKTGEKDIKDINQKTETEAPGPGETPEQTEKNNRIKVNVKTDTRDATDPQGMETETVKQMQETLAALEKEKNDINDKLLRAAAEFDNQKKRMDRQWADFKKYANESLAKELLTVVDNLERAIAAAEDTGEGNSGLVDGVKMTLAEILKILGRHGVTPIESTGEKFDPNFHQAVSTQQVEGTESNIVLEEYQKGYMMHDRLLRPAMVVVSASAQQNKTAAE